LKTWYIGLLICRFFKIYFLP